MTKRRRNKKNKKTKKLNHKHIDTKNETRRQNKKNKKVINQTQKTKKTKKTVYEIDNSNYNDNFVVGDHNSVGNEYIYEIERSRSETVGLASRFLDDIR